MRKKWNFIFKTLIVTGILLVFLSICLAIYNQDISSMFSTISTIISIILGAGSFVYTYVSGEETLNHLDEIKSQNDRLVSKINYELSKENYDNNNIENVDRLLNEKLKIKTKFFSFLNNYMVDLKNL